MEEPGLDVALQPSNCSVTVVVCPAWAQGCLRSKAHGGQASMWPPALTGCFLHPRWPVRVSGPGMSGNPTTTCHPPPPKLLSVQSPSKFSAKT